MAFERASEAVSCASREAKTVLTRPAATTSDSIATRSLMLVVTAVRRPSTGVTSSSASRVERTVDASTTVTPALIRFTRVVESATKLVRSPATMSAVRTFTSALTPATTLEMEA
jgi:hypothetical protein